MRRLQLQRYEVADFAGAADEQSATGCDVLHRAAPLRVAAPAFLPHSHEKDVLCPLIVVVHCPLRSSRRSARPATSAGLLLALLRPTITRARTARVRGPFAAFGGRQCFNA